MKRVKWLVGVLLVLVMLETVVSAVVIPRQSGIVNVVSAKNITDSPNDVFNLQEIRDKIKGYSKEEIKKKYEKALKESFQQYIRALQKIEKYKANWNYSNDDEKSLIGAESYYHRDETVDGGIAVHGGSGVGNSDAWINGNEILKS